MSGVLIQPIIETTIQTINTIVCKIMDIKLGHSATIITEFYDTKGTIVKATTDILSGDDYLNWGSDDKYIYIWICKKYNLILQK